MIMIIVEDFVVVSLRMDWKEDVENAYFSRRFGRERI